MQRTEWWQQCYVWADGVHIDYRCEFGSAHLPGVFQRVSTFIVAVIRWRIQEFDRFHPYSRVRCRWQEARQWRGLPGDVSFARVYLDDIFGCTVLEEGEPMEGGYSPGHGPVRVLCELGPAPVGSSAGPWVKLSLFACMSRAQIHLEIATGTCRDAGWQVNPDKRQLGETVEVLGMMVDAASQRIAVPAAKRLGMMTEIRHLARTRQEVQRGVVETLVGRCTHIAMVMPEAKAYLAPMWRMQYAKRRVNLRRGGRLAIRPQLLHVHGEGAGPVAFRAALRWWYEALLSGVSVPLAPRLSFPLASDSGCAFGFTDAARETGTGLGGFSIVRVRQVTPPVMLYLESRWPEEMQEALQQDKLSMALGELFGLAVMAEALHATLAEVSHLIMFSDSSAAVGAIQSACSPSPQMNHVLQWLFDKLGSVQVLAVHQPGVHNPVADAISRDGLRATLEDARAHGLETCELTLADDAWHMLLACSQIPQSRHYEIEPEMARSSP